MFDVFTVPPKNSIPSSSPFKIAMLLIVVPEPTPFKVKPLCSASSSILAPVYYKIT